MDLRAAHLNGTAMRKCLFIAVSFYSALLVVAHAQEGPKNGVVLIIRHAENGGSGHALAPSGQQRAEAYKDYFLNFTVDSKRLEPNAIFAAKDSKQSHRPRLTVEPFAKAAKLKIDTHFGNNQSAELAAELRADQQGKVILICWRHPYVPDLLRALGATPEDLLRVANGRFGLRLGNPSELRSGRPFDSPKFETDQQTPDAG